MSLKTVLSAAMLLCASTALIGVDSAAAYPVPKPVPTAWELKCTPGILRLFADPADGKLYWYMTYQVQKSGRDQIWVPDMTLFSDTGVISKAGVGVPSRVSESIRALQGNPLWKPKTRSLATSGKVRNMPETDWQFGRCKMTVRTKSAFLLRVFRARRPVNSIPSAVKPSFCENRSISNSWWMETWKAVWPRQRL